MAEDPSASKQDDAANSGPGEDEAARNALLLNSTRLLNLLKEEDGTRLENIKSSDVQEALTVIGEPAAIVDKKRAAMSAEAQLLIDSLRKQLKDSKGKVSDLMARLDADGDGQLDRDELRTGLRVLFEGLATQGEDAVVVTDEMLEQVLDVFDSDGSGTVDASEFNRALWSTQRLIKKDMRTGGMGVFHVRGENRRQLRQTTDDIDQIGSKLILEVVPHLALVAGEVQVQPEGREALNEEDMHTEHTLLQRRLCEEMSRHFMLIVRSFLNSVSDGHEQVQRKTFCIGIAKLFGMRQADVGALGAQALRRATLALFNRWDIASLGELELSELMKILRKGGSVGVPKRARKDCIFQAEIAECQLTPARVKQTAISLAKQALHGFEIQTREEQLHNRAERVAPVQLESLLSAMSEDTGTLLDLFLRWDVDGDGTVAEEEFSAAIAHLGFKFSTEVCNELFRFFDKDGSGSVSLEEIEGTLAWGRDRKRKLRPLLAGWRQLSLDMVDGQTLSERIRERLQDQGLHPIDLFKNWDESGNGTLDREELGDLVFMLGGMAMSDQERDALFDSFDKDGSGAVTFKELNAALRNELPVEKLMARLADPDVMTSLFELFHDQWDTDGDGVLTEEEFVNAMKSIGLQMDNREVMHDLFCMLDEDSSGAVSLKELEHTIRWVRSCDMCQQLRAEAYSFTGTLSIQEQIKRALAANSVKVLDLFREWDANGDGVVSLNEFLRAMPMLGIHAPRDELTNLFHSLDTDNDNMIAFKEFNRILRKVSEDEAKQSELDEFGREVQTSWRPKSPVVAVVDLSVLRRNVKTEHRLRGLDRSALKGIDPGAGSQTSFSRSDSPMPL